MSHSKKFSSLCGWIWTQPRVKIRDARGSSLDDLPDMLAESCIVKISGEDEDRCVEILGNAGASVLEQYEAVRAGLADTGAIETVAKASAQAGDTSAVLAKETEFHQDGYQFQREYRGHVIAGVGNMPDIELLCFPKVVEGRFLVFSDLCRATRKFMRAHESSQIDHLCQACYSIDSRYADADPNLDTPHDLPLLFKDSLGWRFHLGGSMSSADPLAGFSLSLFRAYVASTVITERLESGSLYVVNQRRIAHRGIRVPGVDGKTVLRRVLLGFPKAVSA